VSDRFEAAYNELLTLDATERQEALDRHLPWGTPASPAGATNEHVLVNEHYVIGYDDDLRIPLWVAYRLRDSDVAGSRERTECFRRDPRLTMTAAAFCADYAEPTFDRGHMVPNADMEWSEAAMINTYIFSEVSSSPRATGRWPVGSARSPGYRPAP
jgi:DNA/RNA endonuclease G (NUC1)